MTSSSESDGQSRVVDLSLIVCLLLAVAICSVFFSIAVSSVGLGMAAGVMAVAFVRDGRKVIRKNGLETVLLLFCAAEMLSSIFSVDPADSFYNIRRVVLFAIVYLTVFAFNTDRRMKLLLICLGAAGALVSLIETVSVTKFGGLVERPQMFQIALTEGGLKMIVSLLLLPFVFVPNVPRKWRIGMLALLIPLLVGLAVTLTRSAWVGFLAGVAAIGMARDRRILALLVLGLVVLLLFGPADLRGRALSIFDLSDISNLGRVHMVETGWRMFLDRPVTGWGDTGLHLYYITYTDPVWPGEGGHMHNNFLQALVTLGMIGFPVVIGLFYRIFILLLDGVKRGRRGWFWECVSLGGFGAYCGFQVMGIFEWNFGDQEVMVLLWFIVGAVSLSLSNDTKSEGLP